MPVIIGSDLAEQVKMLVPATEPEHLVRRIELDSATQGIALEDSVTFTESGGVYTIDPQAYSGIDAFRITVSGAQVRFAKGSTETRLAAVGHDGKVYVFDFNEAAGTVTVTSSALANPADFQPKITATGTTNLLTAPASAGGQPGTKAIADLLASPAAQTANTQLLVAPSTKGAAPTLKPIADFQTRLRFQPHTWAVNTEIDLGDGDYGCRWTGNASISANVWGNIALAGAVTCSEVVDYGGSWNPGSAALMSAKCSYGATGGGSATIESSICWGGASFVFSSICNAARAGTTNNAYKLWAVYRK